nr:MAG TPA: hypothetical protein [Caudoviricetes sp.]
MRPLYYSSCIELIFTHQTNNCGYNGVSTVSGVGRVQGFMSIFRYWIE